MPLKDNDQKSPQLGNERITNNFGYEQKMVVSGDDQQLPTNPPSPPYITKTVGYESEFSQKMSWRNRQMRCQMQKNLVSNYVAHLKQLIKHQKIIQNQPVVSTFQPTFPPKINLTCQKASSPTVEPNLLAVDKNYVKVSLPIEMVNSTKTPLSLKQIMRFLRLDQPVLLQRNPLLVCQNHSLTRIVVFPKDGEKEFNCQPLSFDHYKIK